MPGLTFIVALFNRLAEKPVVKVLTDEALNAVPARVTV